MKKFSCVFSTGEILEWEAPGLTAPYWKDVLMVHIMDWWDENNKNGQVIVSVDGQASFALVRTVYEEQYPYAHQVCEIRLMRLRKWEPIGGHIIRKFITAE